MAIEIFGLPGSGKSTIAKSVAKACSVRLITINKFERFLYLIFFLVRFPMCSIFWCRKLFFDHVSYELFRYKLNLLSISMAKVAKGMLKSEALIDEGLFQRILSVAEHDLGQEEIRRYFSHIPGNGRLIIVKGGGFNRFVSESDRFNSPRFKLGEDYYLAWQKTVVSNFEKMSLLVQSSSAKILVADNAKKEDLAGIVQEIAKFVKIVG